ncbi:MAG: hypothetical protein A4E65_02090 [Syntrophorhabdus sp. PtaU1.Bin153]|nr:MAG: hypothetical protein A4E65_02090 [Syntrophorhabdus sp. PtaU1.Bin153]
MAPLTPGEISLLAVMDQIEAFYFPLANLSQFPDNMINTGASNLTIS